MKIEKNNMLDIVMYPIVVKAIADGYFDDEKNYDPALGRISAMGIYYKICITKSDFDLKVPHDVEDIMELKDVVEDRDICEAFEDAVWMNVEPGLSFGNAFSDAARLVEKMNDPASIIARTINKAIESMTSLITEDTLNTLTTISNAIKENQFNPDAFVEAYGKSEHFQDLLNRLEANDKGKNSGAKKSKNNSVSKKSSKSKQNVVPFKK